MTILAAVVIGVVAGGLVVGSVLFFDRIKIDDPVGAISVHLVCGIWGTLAVGIFSTNPEHSLFIQLVGVLAYGVFTFAAAMLIFGVLKATLGIRVTEEEELEGLDLAEHGGHAYDFGSSTRGIEDDMVRGAGVSRSAPSLAANES